MGEVRCVGNVEELGPELHSHVFGYDKSLGETEIELDHPVAPCGCATDITDGSPVVQFEGTFIKPIIHMAELGSGSHSYF